MKSLEVRGYVKSTNDFTYNPIVDFEKGLFDTGLRETNGRATGIVYEDIEFLDICINEKDKNGNKLYKNDIVQFRCKTYQIVFIEGAFMLNDAFSKCSEYLKHEYTFWSKVEKIGNIYQNKDLLEQS